MERVLVTGGAGFIGSHVVDALLERGCQVMSFDCLLAQVHPLTPAWPDYQDPDTEGLETWFGDVRDVHAVLAALAEFRPDTVIHLAARVGVAQGDTMPAPYVSCNVTGTAALLDAILAHNGLVRDRERELANWEPLDVSPLEGETQEAAEARATEADRLLRERVEALPDRLVDRVFVAGSMSSYGEGLYGEDVQGEGWTLRGASRDEDDMSGGWFEAVTRDAWASGLRPIGITEASDFWPASVYAWSKAQQEELSLLIGQVRGLDVRVGRLFNTYGPRQALSNPYTGVGAIFSARYLSGSVPIVYEDGEQCRDFIHVRDVASAILAILEDGEPGEAYNVGTGKPTTIREVAAAIGRHLMDLGDDEEPPMSITGEWRSGDIRHCYADASKLRALGWEPEVVLADGIADLVDWVRDQQDEDETTLNKAHAELHAAGLLGGAQ